MGAFCTWVGIHYTLQGTGLTLPQFAQMRPDAFLGLWAYGGGPVGVS